MNLKHFVTEQKFIHWGVILVGLIFAWQIGLAIGDSSEVPFAILSNSVVGLIALLAFVSPKTGLYLVVLQAMYTDEFKRLSIVQAGASMDLVITVLIGPLITLCVMNLSIFMKAVVFKTIKVKKTYWCMIAAIILITIAMVVFGAGELSTRGQFAANLGIYLTLLPMISLLLPTMKEWREFMFIQLILVLPSAIWGIKQYFFGFTSLEWAYARTGLSSTHTIQMLGFDHPRIFGFLGSASAFGCMSLYGTYALWQWYSGKVHRLIFLLMATIFMVAIVCSTQRSMLLIPFIILVSYWLMLSPFRTGLFYIAMISLLVLGVVFSQYLLDQGIGQVNEVIRNDSAWGQEVLNVSTFSDRLQGWTHFLEPSTWTIFGNGEMSDEEFMEKGGHDTINKVLLKTGVAGLIPLILIVVGSLTILHRVVWRAKTRELQKEGAFLLASFVPLLMMNIMGGGNLNTVPINLQTWSMLAGILVFRNEYNINVFKSKAQFLYASEQKNRSPMQMGVL